MKKAKQKFGAQLVVRVPADLRKFYVALAKKEEQRLSDALRVALEDRAQQLREARAA